jgi:hypothetical protein
MPLSDSPYIILFCAVAIAVKLDDPGGPPLRVGVPLVQTLSFQKLDVRVPSEARYATIMFVHPWSPYETDARPGLGLTIVAALLIETSE